MLIGEPSAFRFSMSAGRLAMLIRTSTESTTAFDVSYTQISVDNLVSTFGACVPLCFPRTACTTAFLLHPRLFTARASPVLFTSKLGQVARHTSVHRQLEALGLRRTAVWWAPTLSFILQSNSKPDLLPVFFVQYIGHWVGPYFAAGGAGDDAVPKSATGGAREAAGALLLRKQPGKQPKARSQKACLCLWLTMNMRILQSSGHSNDQLSSCNHSQH